MTKEQLRESKLRAMNNEPGNLKGADCPKCRNKGYYFTVTEDDKFISHDCECMKRRKSMMRLQQSGLQALLDIYTFERYEEKDRATADIKNAARQYVHEKTGWFFISGRPGSGKTHICTAICGAFLKQNMAVRYMLWRERAPQLKALVNDREEYERSMAELKNCDALYIDDFLKGNVTEADINLAFELLNARYNRPDKLTIISTEKGLEKILGIDEAIGSRIYERSRRFCIKAPEVNRRLE